MTFVGLLNNTFFAASPCPSHPPVTAWLTDQKIRGVLDETSPRRVASTIWVVNSIFQSSTQHCSRLIVNWGVNAWYGCWFFDLSYRILLLSTSITILTASLVLELKKETNIGLYFKKEAVLKRLTECVVDRNEIHFEIFCFTPRLSKTCVNLWLEFLFFSWCNRLTWRVSVSDIFNLTCRLSVNYGTARWRPVV